MTRTQDRFRRKIKHFQSQVKILKRQKVELQADMDKQTSSISGKIRKAEGKMLMARIDKAIIGSQKDIKLLEMQL